MDVVTWFNNNSGTRKEVVALKLDEKVDEYGDGHDQEEHGVEEQDAQSEAEPPDRAAASSTLKRNARPDTDEVQYMRTKRVKAP